MSEFLTVPSGVALLVFLSAALSIAAYLPYIGDTLRGRTRPQRASWLIWSVLGSIAFASQLYEGAQGTLWFAGAQVSGTITVFVLSLWRGKGELLSPVDVLALGVAAIGLVLWHLTDTAAYALAITISISMLGGVLTILKTYRDPGSETTITWILSFCASVCTIAAAGTVNPVILAYPVYLLVLNGGIILAIMLGRQGQTRHAG